MSASEPGGMRVMELPEDIRAEYPFASKFSDVGGARMHYVDEGPRDAPALVMVHGNPTWSFMYRNIIKAFSGSHRCIAVDHVGCGLSDKPNAREYKYTLSRRIADLDALMNELQPREVTLIVHDWGGPIGIGWGLRHVDTLRRLVVMNTAAFLVNRIPFRIAVCRYPGFGELAVLGCNAFAGAATRMATTQPGGLPPVIARGFVLPYDSWANRIATLKFVHDIPLTPSDESFATVKSIEEQLPKLRGLPTKIFWGDKDFCFTPLFLEHWKKHLPEAEVTRFAEAGHYVLEDAREPILAALGEFIGMPVPQATRPA